MKKLLSLLLTLCLFTGSALARSASPSREAHTPARHSAPTAAAPARTASRFFVPSENHFLTPPPPFSLLHYMGPAPALAPALALPEKILYDFRKNFLACL